MTNPLRTPVHTEHDLNQAAYLVVCEFRFLGVRESGRAGRYGFCFEDADDKAQMAVTDFVNNKPTPVRSFADAIARLKTLLYAAKGR